MIVWHDYGCHIVEGAGEEGDEKFDGVWEVDRDAGSALLLDVLANYVDAAGDLVWSLLAIVLISRNSP